MKYDVTELTNEGKRNLLRTLCDELSYAEISRLVEPYARRLELDEMREPYILLQGKENDLGHNQILWLDVNDIQTETVEE